MRAVEALVQDASAPAAGGGGGASTARDGKDKDADTRAFEKDLSDALGLKVEIKPRLRRERHAHHQVRQLRPARLHPHPPHRPAAVEPLRIREANRRSDPSSHGLGLPCLVQARGLTPLPSLTAVQPALLEWAHRAAHLQARQDTRPMTDDVLQRLAALIHARRTETRQQVLHPRAARRRPRALRQEARRGGNRNRHRRVGPGQARADARGGRPALSSAGAAREPRRAARATCWPSSSRAWAPRALPRRPRGKSKPQ